MSKVLLIIDVHALIHRFFHALPPMTAPSGEPVNAIYGLSSVLLKILREQKPDYLAAAFDTPEETFREKEFRDYKIHRPPAADELVSQLKTAPEVFDHFRVKKFAQPGFEADDIIGTLVERFKKEPDLKIIILSGDLDVLQLVDDEKVLAEISKTGVTETVLYNQAMVEERYGLKPSQLPDLKGFVGDVSDNISGVKGIGPKTAAPLIREFKTVEEVFENLGLLPEKIFKKLEEHKDEAILSKKLATIRRDVPLECSLEDLKQTTPNKKELEEYFVRLGFKSLVKRL